MLRSLLSIGLVVFVSTTIAQEVGLQKLVNSTWQVHLPDGRFGTAFIIDSSGYFVTAAHVVAKSDNSGVVEYYGDVELGAGAEPHTLKRNARFVSSLCDEIDFGLKLCRRGYDAALLKSGPLPEEYEPFELVFIASAETVFEGHFTGYSNRAVGPAPSSPVIFNLVDVSAHPEYKSYFEQDSSMYYQTLGGSFPGNSGGPITIRTDRGPEVVGLVAWRKPGFDPNDSAGPSFGSPVHALHKLLESVSTSEPISRLADDVAKRRINVDSLSLQLSGMRNIEVVKLIDELQNFSQDGNDVNIENAYWYKLYDEATLRELDFEKQLLEERVNFERNVSWLRESAKSKARIGRHFASLGNTDEAMSWYEQSIDLNKSFLVKARISEAQWFGGQVFASVSDEMVTTLTTLGDTSAALDWAVAGSRAGASNATVRLANISFHRRDFENSARLYALAFAQATVSRDDVPLYIEAGYNDSLDGIILYGGGRTNDYPSSVNEASAKVSIDVIPDIDWINTNWQSILETYAPKSIEEAALTGAYD